MSQASPLILIYLPFLLSLGLHSLEDLQPFHGQPIGLQYTFVSDLEAETSSIFLSFQHLVHQQNLIVAIDTFHKKS